MDLNTQTLAEYVYAEEIATGTAPDNAAIIADSVVASPAYMLGWMAGRAARQRDRKRLEEILLTELSYPGNPEEWEVRGY